MKKILLSLLFVSQMAFCQQGMRISEIMFNPPEAGNDSLEFIELFNSSNEIIDITDWYFSAGIVCKLPSLAVLPGEYLLLSRDTVVFKRFFGKKSIQWQSGSLSNTKESIVLRDKDNSISDSVIYNTTSKWPDRSKGLGSSIVLCDITSDVFAPESWNSSASFCGLNSNKDSVYASPGYRDSVCGSDLLPLFTHYPLSEDVQVPLDCKVLINFNSKVFKNNQELLVEQDVSRYIKWRVEGQVSDSVVFEASIIDEGATFQLKPLLPLKMNCRYQIEINDGLEDIGGRPIQTYIWSFVTSDVVEKNLSVVMISEIMYNPSGQNSDSLEFVELYNKADYSINIQSWKIQQGIQFVFPDITINPKSYIVIAKDSAVFRKFYGVSALQWGSDSLKNEGELLLLVDNQDNLVDSVYYKPELPWPIYANGKGSSLVMCDDALDNSVSSSWFASYDYVNYNDNYDLIYANPGESCDEVYPNEGESQGIALADNNGFSVLVNADNLFVASNQDNVSFILLNSLGQKVFAKEINIGLQTFFLGNYTKGVYLAVIIKEGRLCYKEKIMVL